VTNGEGISWDQLPMFLTVEEVATLMRVNHKTVRGEVSRGHLRDVRAGRTVRFHRDEVRRYVEAGGQPPEPARRKR
jgi:excisionase family DNA binding protein